MMMLCKVLTLTFNHTDVKGVKPARFFNWFNGNKTKAGNQLKKNQQETQGSPTDTHRGLQVFISCLDGCHSSSRRGQKASVAAEGMTALRA